MLNKFLTIFFLFFVLNAHSTIIYVKPSSSGAANGTSWSNAYGSITTAIGAASNGDSIWIRQGTYTLYSAVTLKSGTHMFGGFAGNETDLSQRNIPANQTLISGETGTVGQPADNTQVLFKATNLSFGIEIDGFYFRDAYNDGSSSYGSALVVENSRTIVRNCSFAYNYADRDGGAIYFDVVNTNNSYTLTLEDSYFLYNTAEGSGGAVRSDNGNVIVKNCIFTGNEAQNGSGGGLDNSGGLGFFVVDRSTFSGNIAGGSGAGINSSTTSDFDTVMNSQFVGNHSYYGSALFLQNNTFSGVVGACVVINCTVAHNLSDAAVSSPSYEAAIQFYGTGFPRAAYNCISWGNRALSPISTFVTLANNITDNPAITGNGNSNANPQFVNPASGYNEAPFFASSYNYRLGSTSPAVDAGNNNYLVAPYTKDIDRVDRPHGLITDIGCYEQSYCINTPALAVTGDTVFCNGHSAVLTAPAGRSYLWSNNATTQSITVNTSGSYNLFMVDSAYCRGIVAQTITVTTATAAIALSGNDTFCTGTTVSLTAPAGTTYLWSNGSAAQSINTSATGNFTVTVTDANGCLSIGTQSTYLSPASVNITGQNVICGAQNLTLNTTATSGSTYLWSTGSITSNITVSQPGTYSVTITNRDNCTATATKTITQQPVVVPSVTIASTDNGACAGETISFTATPVNGGSATYLWKKNNVSVGFSGNPYTSSTLNNGDLITVQLTSGLVCANPAVVTSPAVTAVVYPVP
ncbi:MAG TPA: choice-of-anchor Q domain-containing protein, partial [Chitinophagales bacterium]|nr:choice-of-anchor Q domain-containing protein [Chitinophagales bacterium]